MEKQDWMVPLATTGLATELPPTEKVPPCSSCRNDEWISAVSGKCYSPPCRLDCDQCGDEVGRPAADHHPDSAAYAYNQCPDCYRQCRECGDKTRLDEENDPYSFCGAPCCPDHGWATTNDEGQCVDCGDEVEEEEEEEEEPAKGTPTNPQYAYLPGHGPCACGVGECNLCLCGDDARTCGGRKVA